MSGPSFEGVVHEEESKEEALANQTLVGAASSGVGSSGRPPRPELLSLTLEVQLQNARRILKQLGESKRFKEVKEMVMQLREDPEEYISQQGFYYSSWVDISEDELYYKTPPLHLAALIGEAAMVRDILTPGRAPSAVRYSDATLFDAFFSTICIAVVGGNPNIVECLVEHGDSVTRCVPWQNNVSVLRQAVISENPTKFDILDILLANNVNVPDLSGMTALDWAAEEGAEDVAEYLLKKMDVNLRDELGRTPLHRAVMEMKSEVVKQLVRSTHNVKVNEEWEAKE